MGMEITNISMIRKQIKSIFSESQFPYRAEEEENILNNIIFNLMSQNQQCQTQWLL